MEPQFEEVQCNICKADNYYEISKKGKFGLPTNVVLCKECGLGYLNPRWDKDSYLHFYRYEYDKYYRPEVLNKEDLKINSENPILKRMEQYNTLPSSAHHILDIGSGEGTNLNDFKSFYPKSKIYAIEPSVDSHENLEKIGAKVISDDVDADWDNDYQNKFDIIIMRHVLEHFMDPFKIMEKIKQVLTPEGIVYVAVPNNLNPTSILRSNWFRNVHTYYFNKFSLRNLLTRAELEIVHIVEGDKMNRGEVYLIAKTKNGRALKSTISKEHFELQKSIFVNKLRKEAYFVFRLYNFLKKKLKGNTN